MARRLIGVVVLLVALAGCGGDPKADPPPSPSPSTTPVSTTPAAPAMPDAAKENSKAGAIAFVRHYVELINYAQQTGDTSALSAVQDAACDSCRRVQESISGIYRAGGDIQGGTWHGHFKVGLRNDDGSWLVTGAVTFDQERVRKSRGATAEAQPGGSALTHLTVKNTGADWIVLAWSRES